MKKKGVFGVVLWTVFLGLFAWTEGATWLWSQEDRAVAWDGAEGKLSLQMGPLDIEGEGDLLLLRPQEDRFDPVDLDKELCRGREAAVLEGDLLACRLRLKGRKGPQFLAVIQAKGGEVFVEVPFKKIGLPASATMVGYHLTEGRFMPPLRGSCFLSVPRDGAVLCVVANVPKVPSFLCSTGILNGDISTGTNWDSGTGVLSGSLAAEAVGRKDLLFFLPSKSKVWRVEDVSVASRDGSNNGRARFLQTGNFLRACIDANASAEIDWYVSFQEEEADKSGREEVYFEARAVGARQVELTCYAQGRDLVVERNDGYRFFQKGTWTLDTAVRPDTSYTYELFPLEWRRLRKPLAAAEANTFELPPMPPLPQVYLSDLDPIKAVNGWNGEPRKDKSIEDNPISLRGEIFSRGMGVHANSELVYRLEPSYKRFVSVVGVDDEKNDSPSGSVTFEVLADDKRLFKTGMLTPQDDWVSIEVPIPAGAETLRLLVGDGGNGIACDHADWANAGFLTE